MTNRNNKTIQKYRNDKKRIKVVDNFESIGVDNFVKLALSALEVSNVTSLRGGDKQWIERK